MTTRGRDALHERGSAADDDWKQKYPNRPQNHSRTLAFHDLLKELFIPLNENKKKPIGMAPARSKTDPNVRSHSAHEIRRAIIERFISRWRRDVGDDIYPAFRLILPEKDRDRAMYGLKESGLARLFIQIMKIDRNSEDGYNLLHWKLPGMNSTSSLTGDFAGRCYEVIRKRPMLSAPGEMTIAEVNHLLDQLAEAQREENQMPIMEEFYRRMSAEELMWLVRMILRQMKIGAAERTIFNSWHPDAHSLFNISSSLRRVCWDLCDPRVRLGGDENAISLMQCFQPQLAAFQMRSIEQMVTRLQSADEDKTFFIEEKLDGERIQMHMIKDSSDDVRFGFWSRKAKDYTYLYGCSLDDPNAALTRHLRNAFHSGVRNIILDGEMITWDPLQDAIVPFGTLKTAALSEQANPFASGHRPLYRIFDCLFLNDVNLTRYTLRKRREALAASVNDVSRRFEIHTYREATTPSEVERELRSVIATAGEGLVIKNPRSEYRLNQRNDDWTKVKPEYMAEFGEALDCLIIGGYYGSGHRGGKLSSFLCGLRVDDIQINQGADPMKCFSFFKVGGGFTANDYAEIRHRTEGKWIEWDPKTPPKDYIELGGADRQYEKPDVWIKPCDSIVIAVKAASVSASDQFRTGFTLRFPRFKKIKTDRDWRNALSLHEFLDLKARVEEERKERMFQLDDEKSRRFAKKRKLGMFIQGQNAWDDHGRSTKHTSSMFEGMSFFVMTDAISPQKRDKSEIEQLIRQNSGSLASSERHEKTLLIADRRLVKVAAIQKRGLKSLIRPQWLYDCVQQQHTDQSSEPLLLPLERRHMFHVASLDQGLYDENTDRYGDSYATDVVPADLRADLANARLTDSDRACSVPSQTIVSLGIDFPASRGFLFRGLKILLCSADSRLSRIIHFAHGESTLDQGTPDLTHIVCINDKEKAADMHALASKMKRTPRVVSQKWVYDSWREQTLLDEEVYPSSA